jgi:hypothetical protein
MPWIVGNMKWIMILCGLLTSTMIYAALSPAKALESTFGESAQRTSGRIDCAQLGRVDRDGRRHAHLCRIPAGGPPDSVSLYGSG